MLHKLSDSSISFVQAVSCFGDMIKEYNQAFDAYVQLEPERNEDFQEDLLRDARLSMLRYDETVVECAARDSGFTSDITAQVHNVGEYYLSDPLTRSQLYVKTAFITHRKDIVFVTRTIKGKTEILTGNFHITTDMINLVGDFEDTVANLYLEGLADRPLIADLPVRLRNTILCTLKSIYTGKTVGSDSYQMYVADDHDWEYFDVKIPSIRLPEVKPSSAAVAFEIHAMRYNLPKDTETLNFIHRFISLLHVAALGKYWTDVPSLTDNEMKDYSERFQYRTKDSKTRIESYFQQTLEEMQEEFDDFIAEIGCGEFKITTDRSKEVVTRNVIIAIKDKLDNFFVVMPPVAKEIETFRTELVSSILKSLNQSTLFERLTEIIMSRTPLHPSAPGQYNLLTELVEATQLCFAKPIGDDLRIAMRDKKLISEIVIQSGILAFMGSDI